VAILDKYASLYGLKNLTSVVNCIAS